MKWYKVLQKFKDFEVGKLIQCDDEQAKALVAAKLIEESKEGPSADVDVGKMVADMKAQVEAAVKDLLKSTVDGINAGVKAAALPKRDDSEADHPYRKDFGSFATDVAGFNGGKGMSDRLKKYVNFREAGAKTPLGQNETVGEDGGVLIPDEMAANIYAKSLDDGTSFQALTDKYTCAGNNMAFRVLREDSRLDGYRHGGCRGYWVDEAEQITPSSLKFDKDKLELNKLAVLIYATSEMLEDIVLLDQFLTRTASAEIRFLVNDAIIRGVGRFQPLGVLGAGAASTLTVPRAAAGLLQAVDISNMWMRMHPDIRGQAVWLINQEHGANLDQMHYQFVVPTAGAYGIPQPVYMPGPNGGPGTIKGRPVIITDFAEAAGTAGDVIAVSFADYRTLTKSSGGIQSAMSIHLRFDYDETAFRFTFRIDGQPTWKNPITPWKGVNTLSTCVKLGDAVP